MSRRQATRGRVGERLRSERAEARPFPQGLDEGPLTRYLSCAFPLLYRRSAAACFALRRRTLRACRVGRCLGHAREDDLLVPKGRHELQLSTQRGNIALQSGDLAVGEVLSALQAGDVRLIDHG